MRDSINQLKDRERGKRLETLHQRAKQIRTDDDWKIDRSKGDPVAVQKLVVWLCTFVGAGWFGAF